MRVKRTTIPHRGRLLAHGNHARNESCEAAIGTQVVTMPNETAANWAYASMLAGGLLIIVGGVAGATMMGFFDDAMSDGWMMGDAGPMMRADWVMGMAWWMATVAVLTGGVILYAAYRLRQGGNGAAFAGTIAIVAGALSLLAMGGWLIGAILAILGGALAIGGGGRAGTQPA